VSVDETTNVMSQMIGNVVIGIPSAEEHKPSYDVNFIFGNNQLLGDSFDGKKIYSK
jgi:iron-sulfur cluster repair protein YtfE (RIC family)